MRKRPSSSQKRKPLLLTSLAASLTLHAGAVYFLLSHPFSFLSASSSTKHDQSLVQAVEPTFEAEVALKETLNRLILREVATQSSAQDSPHLELTKTKLKILTNFAYAPSVTAPTTPPPFHLETPTYTINDSDEFAQLKPNPFDQKNRINFSQPLETESGSLVASTEPQKEKTIPPTLKKIDKLPLAVPKTEKVVSELMPSEHEVKKRKSQKTQLIEKPSTLSQVASNTERPKQKSSPSFVPQAESITKKQFDREALYYFYDEKLESSYTPKLQVSLPLKAPLFKIPISSPKKRLEP
ncbi:MAG: hypothetical protein KDK56_02010, partial [Simkania sp.]|nr:hypothetical protein [Simkania sp.]